MDEIAARAGITKRAVYQHFRSKDDLIAAALAHSSELAIARLQGFRSAPNRDELIDSFFTQLKDCASKPRWSGDGRAILGLVGRSHGAMKPPVVELGEQYPRERVSPCRVRAIFRAQPRGRKASGGPT